MICCQAYVTSIFIKLCRPVIHGGLVVGGPSGLLPLQGADKRSSARWNGETNRPNRRLRLQKHVPIIEPNYGVQRTQRGAMGKVDSSTKVDTGSSCWVSLLSFALPNVLDRKTRGYADFIYTSNSSSIAHRNAIIITIIIIELRGCWQAYPSRGKDRQHRQVSRAVVSTQGMGGSRLVPTKGSTSTLPLLPWAEGYSPQVRNEAERKSRVQHDNLSLRILHSDIDAVIYEKNPPNWLSETFDLVAATTTDESCGLVIPD